MSKLGPYSALGEPRSDPAIAGLLQHGIDHMPLNEPFPLDTFPPRVRAVILKEFNGRCPSQREVAEISDAHWLSTPEVGPALLKRIRALGHVKGRSWQMTDAELLRRLASLQKELKLIQDTVRIGRWENEIGPSTSTPMAYR